MLPDITNIPAWAPYEQNQSAVGVQFPLPVWESYKRWGILVLEYETQFNNTSNKVCPFDKNWLKNV